ncbi:MAG: hypothetical protein IKY83_00065, partial [Proteobacteria bacterium]|nr:hypothetical protein [Pseudomonadota bacterium]
MKSKNLMLLAVASLALLASCQDDSSRKTMSCNEGEVVCGNQCVDPLTSVYFCGANEECMNYSVCTEDQACVEGKCTDGSVIIDPTKECEDGQILCDGQCVDPKTDPRWCGAFDICEGGTPCNDDEACLDGECIPRDQICPTEGEVRCNGVCINPLENPDFCGANPSCTEYSICNAEEGQVCNNGRCVAFTEECPIVGQVMCNGDCVDPEEDTWYCGANAACSVYTTCDLDSSTCRTGECGIKCPEVNHVYLEEYGVCVWRCTKEG